MKGKYLKYLYSKDEKIPRTTAYRRRLQERQEAATLRPEPKISAEVNIKYHVQLGLFF